MFLLNILFETFQVALTGSVYSVVIVATERYFNICKPFHKNLVISFITIDNISSDYFWLQKEPKESILASVTKTRLVVDRDKPVNLIID